MAESQCRFETCYVSLHSNKERLTEQLRQLEKEMETVLVQGQQEQARREELGRQEQELSRREEKVNSLWEERTWKAADPSQLSQLQAQHKSLSEEIDSLSRAMEADTRSKAALRTSVQSLQTLLEEKEKAAKELAQRVKEANVRLAALEQKRLSRIQSLEEAKAQATATARATIALATESKTLLSKLTTEAPETSQEFPLTERSEHSPASLLLQEEARAKSLHLSMLDCEARLQRLNTSRSDTRSKRLELTQLLSKVEAKLMLVKRAEEDRGKGKASAAVQRREAAAEVQRLRDQKEEGKLRKWTLETEMDRLEGEFDSLQAHLFECVQRERKVIDSKARSLQELQALRVRKEQQVASFQALKTQKQEVLAKELQVEALQSRVLGLKQELKQMQQTADFATSVTDLDTQLSRLSSEDERWQRGYRAEQEKLKQQAEFLRVQEKRLSRASSPRTGE